MLGEDALLRRAVCALARADKPLFFAVLHVRQIPKETPNREHSQATPSKRHSSFTNWWLRRICCHGKEGRWVVGCGWWGVLTPASTSACRTECLHPRTRLGGCSRRTRHGDQPGSTSYELSLVAIFQESKASLRPAAPPRLGGGSETARRAGAKARRYTLPNAAAKCFHHVARGLGSTPVLAAARSQRRQVCISTFHFHALDRVRNVDRLGGHVPVPARTTPRRLWATPVF